VAPDSGSVEAERLALRFPVHRDGRHLHELAARQCRWLVAVQNGSDDVRREECQSSEAFSRAVLRRTCFSEELLASDGADRPTVDDELSAVNGGRPVGGQVSDKVGDLFGFGATAD